MGESNHFYVHPDGGVTTTPPEDQPKVQDVQAPGAAPEETTAEASAEAEAKREAQSEASSEPDQAHPQIYHVPARTGGACRSALLLYFNKRRSQLSDSVVAHNLAI